MAVDAEEDILAIWRYVAHVDSVGRADRLIDELRTSCLSLSAFPDRGHLPPELERIGIGEFREIHCKPYRIIYRLVEGDVFVHCVLDGRRDLQLLLVERAIRPRF
ncbi:type II toxin-antitoxin system RelE/ParE family toxin [Chlorobium sp. N1]|uniref:type II toxin-antitoxin system RelE/ParE family toxin n=1 Tax=Chlorobium sp. N1 TaxID=2491138 RepID=UPI001F6080F0|nr:type II toxin-antitoxin system RelE/ParE family toxin [Chlorobium sp. N1]